MLNAVETVNAHASKQKVWKRCVYGKVNGKIIRDAITSSVISTTHGVTTIGICVTSVTPLVQDVAKYHSGKFKSSDLDSNTTSLPIY